MLNCDEIEPIMIKFSKPEFGWINIQILDKKFCASYLTDVWEELDCLFNLPDRTYVNKAILDGESQGELSLVAYLSDCDDVLNIIWQLNNKEPYVMSFSYDAFMMQYEEAKKEISLDAYIKNFIYEDRYERITEMDNFLYEYERLLKKYPNIEFGFEYDRDGSYRVYASDRATNEKRFINGE